jgi:hypothetical protein
MIAQKRLLENELQMMSEAKGSTQASLHYLTSNCMSAIQMQEQLRQQYADLARKLQVGLPPCACVCLCDCVWVGGAWVRVRVCLCAREKEKGREGERV